MQTIEAQLRYPRPISRFPRSPLLNNQDFTQVMTEIKPLLLTMAHHISRPYYIDPEDLVQEAMLKIFHTRARYNSNRNASLKTWILNVALRQFYNIATTEYRKKRVPQGIHISKAFVEIGEMEELSNYKTLFNKYAPYLCQTEYDLRYKELIKRTEIKLPPFAKEVFRTLLEPPETLIRLIKKNRQKKIIEKMCGKSSKIPFHFTVTTEQLAEHFEVPRYKISRAKECINKAMKKAFEE